MATPEKIVYDVEVAPGLVIPIVGSENETDDDLIAKARTHPKFVALQNKNNAPQAEVAQTNKAVVADDSTNLVPGVLPELSSPAELAKTAKKGTDFTNQSVAQPPANAQPDRSEGTTFDLLSQGKFGEAFNTIPETVQKGILVGLPLTAATIAGGLGLKYARSKNEIDGIGPTRGQGINPAERIEPTGGPAETPSNNIKSRTFEAGNYVQQNIQTTPKGMSAKETQIANDIKNKYGYDIGVLKNQFGLSNVPITDITQAEMLANTVRNQEAAAAAAPAEAPKTPVVEAPSERIVNGVKMTEPQYQYYINEAKPGISPAQAIEEMNAKAAMPAAPTQEIKPAPVAETPKAPAPPPETTPKAAVPPEAIEKKLGKPTATTGSGMPAYQGEGDAGSKVKHKKGTINTLNDIPKDMVFVPGGNYMDSVRNAVGQEAYTANLKSSGGYPASNEAAAAQSRQINASLNRPTREEAIAQGLPPKENTKSITQNVGGKKLVKVGGVTGALILASDLANAASQGDYGPIKEAGFDVGVGTVAGVLGGPAGLAAQQALMGTTLAPGVISTDAKREALLSRPGVKDYLEKLRKELTPQQFNVAAERYLASNPNAPKSDWQKFVELNNQRTTEANTKLRAVPPPSMRR